MESDGERYTTMAHHERDVAGDGSAFDDYTRDDDDRSLLESGVIGSSTSLDSSGGGGAGISTRAQPLTEPYDRYKSIELRAECYRRGTRPTRTGPKANDNKAGYLMLLRAYDMTHSPGESNKPLLLPMDNSIQQQQQQLQQQQQQMQQQQQVAKKRRAHSPPESDAQDPTERSSTTVAAPALGGPHNANTAKRRPRVRKGPNDEAEAEQSSFPARISGGTTTQSAPAVANGPTVPAAMTFLPSDQQLATEYMRLKMQILLESREIEKTNRREDQRFKLHGELQGVITTLAQLHRLAKEYTLERDTLLLTDVNQDIAYFQEQKRKIKLEVELLDRYR